jgi:hypothetical protein
MVNHLNGFVHAIDRPVVCFGCQKTVTVGCHVSLTDKGETFLWHPECCPECYKPSEGLPGPEQIRKETENVPT